MNTRGLISAVLLLAVVPAAAEAQRRSRGDRFVERDYNRFSLEPYAGAYNDAYDVSDTNTGYLIGLR
ncbi:MAG: hypothetical protein ACRELX_13020, partial [Longimicrobiales bacterium]